MARFQPLSQDDRGLGPGTRVDSDASHTGLLPQIHSSPPSSSGASYRGPVAPSYNSRPHPDVERVDISERLPGTFKDPNLLLRTRHCVAKWFAPGCLFFTCLVIQNFGLYIGTYYYVMWMDRLHHTIAEPSGASALNLRASHDARHGLTNASAAELLHMREELSSTVGEGALQDVFADLLGRQSVSTSLLDALSGSTPLLLLISTAICRDLRLWTKCCVCGSLMALLKGFLAWATVVPDSIGWDGCKERLGSQGLDFFRSKAGLNFETEFLQSLVDVLNLELWGVSQNGSSKHLRFCADMMFSGHTYVCATFSLGLFSLFRSRTAGMPVFWRRVGRFIVGSALLAIVLFDVMMILVNRFHYTMDVTIALVLVALLFSNPAVAVVAEFWVEYTGENESILVDWRDRDDFRDHGTVLVPPCCFPLCCFTGRYYLHGYPDQHEIFHKNLQTVQEQFDAQLHDMQKQLAEQRQLAGDHLRRLREAEGNSDVLRRSLDKAEQLRQDADKEAVTARATLQQAKKRSGELEKALEELRITRQTDLDSKQGELDRSRKELESERLARCLAEDQARELSVKLETASAAPSTASGASDANAVDSTSELQDAAAVGEKLDAALVDELKAQMAAPIPSAPAETAVKEDALLVSATAPTPTAPSATEESFAAAAAVPALSAPSAAEAPQAETAAAAAAAAAEPEPELRAPEPAPEASAKQDADPVALAPSVADSVPISKVEADVPMPSPELPQKKEDVTPVQDSPLAVGGAEALLTKEAPPAAEAAATAVAASVAAAAAGAPAPAAAAGEPAPVDPTAVAPANEPPAATPASAPEATPEAPAQPAAVVAEQAPAIAAAVASTAAPTASEPHAVVDPTAPAAAPDSTHPHHVDPTAAAFAAPAVGPPNTTGDPAPLSGASAAPTLGAGMPQQQEAPGPE